MGIDQYNVLGGVETSVNARFTPWFGLRDGITVTEYRLTDANEATRLAGLDWQVDEVSLKDIYDRPLADEHKLRVRSSDGAVLGVGSPRYGVIQNSEAERMAEAILGIRPDAHIESAGALFHGKVVWFLVRLDDETKSFRDGDTHYRYMLIYTSHDGTRPFAVRFTNVRVQCMNTFSLAIGKASELVHTIRHTSNAKDYVTEAIAATQAAMATFDLMDLEIERLLTTEMSKPYALAAFGKVLGERKEDPGRSQTMWDNAFHAIVNEWNADYNDDIRGTAWGTVMAVNGYELWDRTVRGRTRPEAQMAALLGGDYALTAKALTLV